MTRPFPLLFLALAMVLTAACTVDKTPHTGSTAPALEAKDASPRSEPDALDRGEAPAARHDPMHPPIDCPLRKHGINPQDLKPFDDVERYIAFLDREDRAAWQRPDAVVEALGLSGAETVVDLGAGSGYFTFRLAAALPRGKVVAIDIEPEMVRHIHHKAMTDGAKNVEVRLARPDDPSIPETADWVFLCDVLHHVQDRGPWLERMHSQLKGGAKVAVIEFKKGDLPEGPPGALKLGKAEVIDAMRNAGFEWLEEKKGLLPYQHVLIFERD